MENKNEKSTEIDELLFENKEMFNNLILEQNNKKDKIFISHKELDLISSFEKNLIKLIENCPPQKFKQLLIDSENSNN